LVKEKYPGHTDLLGNASTNWQDEIFKTAFGMDHYVGASGAFDFMPYRFSIGYTNNDGILKTDNLKRTTLSLNLNPTLFDDHLKINLYGNYMHIQNRFADRGAVGAAVQFDPTKPVKSDTSRFGGYYFWEQANGNPVQLATSNPVAMLEQRKNKSTVNRFLGNAQFDYKFHFLPEIRANLNLGYDYSKSDGTVFVDTTAAFDYDPQFGGGVNNMYEQEKKNELLEFYLNYNKDLSSINSNLDVMMGYSWQHFYRKNYSINSNVVMTPELTDTIDDPTEYYLLSYFGRINYTFMDRYLLTLTLRNDNTSRFSKDNRQGWFPSVAFAWKIAHEKFMEKLKIISLLKLRLSYGVTGQQNINQGDYPYLARYTYNQSGAYYQLGNIFYRTLRPEGYDANIKWEETTTYNIGLDYGFANNRYYGSIDFYLRETKDLLNIVPVPAGTNLTNEILTNIGNLENKGVEFSIFTRPIVRPDLAWEVGLNATYNKNEITKLTASDDPNYLGYLVTGISGGVGNTIQIHSVGYPAFSYFVFEQVYDNDGKPIQGMYVDRNGDGMITDDDRYHYKDPNPDFIFGLSSRIRYKNWDFSFSGRAYFGNYVYNNVESENAVYERLYRPEGPYLGNISTEVTETDFDNPQYLSDYYIQDGSFFRMDYMTLGYNFKNIVKERLNLRVTFTVNSAFVITKYEGLDPEIYLGIDNNIYPRPRTYVLGVNLQF
jgi:iron complex outermembrane receptor protein